MVSDGVLFVYKALQFPFPIENNLLIISYIWISKTYPMKYYIALVFFFMLVSAHSQKLYRYVNPMIGTGGHGHTFPGATVPFGMVQASPDTRIDGSWDGCSGYHYSDSLIYGFSHTHLNGTGVSDFGDIMLMPTMGQPMLQPKEYASGFSHAKEIATAGFYSVILNKDAIAVALTATPRGAIHRYTFSKSGQANIILDLNHRDHLLMGEVRVINDRTIEVLRRSEAWARDQYVFARIEFDQPMTITKVNNNAFAPAKTTDTFFAGSLLAISFSKQVKKGAVLQVKVALSPTGHEGAAKNMAKELPHWNFNKIRKSAEKLWEKELSKIEITTADSEKKTIFYSALYHTMMQPNIAMDVDGKYRGRDNEIHHADGFDYYSVFSLWDTFRAAHPLYTLIDRKRTADYINTFLKQYEQGGRLPVWELASNETDCMIGYHSVSVMADAMTKGITGFDYAKALEASKHSAMLDHLGLKAYRDNGFISIDDEHESVSKTVEYAYDDWCIAQMALLLEQKDTYQYFMERSQSWKNVFNPVTTFMQPKKNGGWDTPFDPREVNNNFTEGNSWQYSFFVPQDIPGMIQAYGGAEAFEAKLDEMFTSPSATTGREQVDITGLIGQYAHGNEPSHHMAYLYNYIGKPEKTTDKVHYILDDFYKNTPDGLIGNEDCGQMSAWYVLSAMGIYAVTPGIPEWSTTIPYFDKVKIHLENGTTATITKNSTAEDLKKIGISAEDLKTKPYNLIVPVPVITAASKSFQTPLTITITADTNTTVFYNVQDQERNSAPVFSKYSVPFTISSSSTIQAYVLRGDDKSHTVTASYYKKPNDYGITLQSVYNPQYHGGGPDGLIDGIRGDENWRKGDWQGYQGQDFEAIIDRKKATKISHFSARFLQDSRAWIVMPTKVEYYGSDDGVRFKLLQTVANKLPIREERTTIVDFEGTVPETTARYIKVKAYNYGPLPDWHQGFGGNAFIFIDEITIH